MSNLVAVEDLVLRLVQVTRPGLGLGLGKG